MSLQPIEILIPNYNGREALTLCLKSLKRYTPEPHRVKVYDDFSSEDEVERLYEARSAGLIDDLNVGLLHLGHGQALNSLLNRCESDRAVIVDNDIHFLRSGWLPALLAPLRAKTIVVCDEKAKGYWPRGFRPPMFLFWLGAINMEVYSEEMSVDWSAEEADRREEPWASYFSDLFPPEDNAIFKDYVSRGGYGEFDRDKVVFDPGCHLRCRMIFDNPKGYGYEPLPPAVRGMFHHWGHAQSWLDPANEGRPYEGPIHASLKEQIAQKLRAYEEGR